MPLHGRENRTELAGGEALEGAKALGKFGGGQAAGWKRILAV